MVELLMQEIFQEAQALLQLRLTMVHKVRGQEVEVPQVVRDLVKAVLEAQEKLNTDFYELTKKGRL
jgi:hypothetical protein